MDKQAIIDASKKRREGERIFYTTCPANGCWDSSCVLKCHLKDGKLIAVEPDDTVNPNNSREDAAKRTTRRAWCRHARAPWVILGRRSCTPTRACCTR